MAQQKAIGRVILAGVSGLVVPAGTTLRRVADDRRFVLTAEATIQANGEVEVMVQAARAGAPSEALAGETLLAEPPIEGVEDALVADGGIRLPGSSDDDAGEEEGAPAADAAELAPSPAAATAPAATSIAAGAPAAGEEKGAAAPRAQSITAAPELGEPGVIAAEDEVLVHYRANGSHGPASARARIVGARGDALQLEATIDGRTLRFENVEPRSDDGMGRLPCWEEIAEAVEPSAPPT